VTTKNGRRPANERKPLLFTIPETAAELRITEPTVYAYIRDGDLEAIDIARPGARATKLRVPYAAIEAYIADAPRVHP
jgi:excisionase family DNA binding protein